VQSLPVRVFSTQFATITRRYTHNQVHIEHCGAAICIPVRARAMAKRHCRSAQCCHVQVAGGTHHADRLQPALGVIHRALLADCCFDALSSCSQATSTELRCGRAHARPKDTQAMQTCPLDAHSAPNICHVWVVGALTTLPRVFRADTVHCAVVSNHASLRCPERRTRHKHNPTRTTDIIRVYTVPRYQPVGTVLRTWRSSAGALAQQ
jgi:hypothetical protein